MSPSVVSPSSPNGVSIETGCLRDLQNAANLLFRQIHAFRQHRRMRFLTRLLQDFARNAVQLVDRFDHVHRHANRPGLVGERTRHSLTDPPRGVRRKLPAATVFELVHRLHQADVAFLDQIEEMHAAVHVLLRDRDHETQIRLRHLALRLTHLDARRDVICRLIAFSCYSGSITVASISISFCCSA